MNFALSDDLRLLAIFASQIAGATSLAFWLGSHRSRSTHSAIAVVTFGIALVLVISLSNKLFLPGIVGPVLAGTVAAYLFGHMGLSAGE